MTPSQSIKAPPTAVQQAPQIEVIAYHGWGYDRHFWQDWEPLLATHQISLRCFDRGYFGHPQAASFSYPHSRKVILAHSYGLHLCPAHQLRIADLVVAFASFVNFHPGEKRAQRRSQRILKQMIDQCQSSPEQVLAAFWQNCGAVPSQGEIQRKDMNTTLLNLDLQDLDHSLLCAEFLARQTPLVIVQGQQDRIVAPERSHELAQACLGLAHRIELAGGHALPRVEAVACWERVRAWVLGDGVTG